MGPRWLKGSIPSQVAIHPTPALLRRIADFDDVRQLLHVLQRLVEAGNTVLVIEHNLDVIKCADWVIDLGPEGGDRGGEVVARGAPEEVARAPRSITGRYLKTVLPKS